MKKLTSLLVFSVILTTIFSCSEDEKKKIAQISFDGINKTVDENAGTIFIPFDVNDGPIDENAELSFEASGTATLDEDYVFEGWDDDGAYFTLVDDDIFESNETLVVTISDSEKVNISSPDTYTVTITDNDADFDLVIDLTWDAGSGTPGDVDMDLVLWEYDPVGDVFTDIDGSFQIGTAFESVTLPGTAVNGTYGLTYQYYEGTSNNLEFTVTFSTENGTLEGTENELIFTETYTLNNVNATTSVFIEQIFDKVGTDYNNFSLIDVPPSGSRIRSVEVPFKFKKTTVSKKEQIPSQKKR